MSKKTRKASVQIEKEKKPVNMRNRIFYTLLGILGFVVVLVVGRYVNIMFFNPMSAFTTPTPLPATPLPTLAPEAAPSITPAPTPTLSPEEELRRQADAEFMQNKVNILMLGWDQSPEREDETSELYRDEDNNYRSDVIMLLTVDFETKRADLISIPRDTYAPIYNTKGRWKINAAFAKGGSAEGEGFLYAMNTVSDLLGVPIQYYAGVDMIGLKNVVDAMGGVDYDVDVRIKLNDRVLETGFQHLNGQQVLDYCRARKGISTDVGRADRQQRMLFAIFEQLKSRNQLVNIPKIFASVQDDMITNLNTEQIAALAVFAMGLESENLYRHTLAGSYVTDVYNASFYVLNNAKLKALIKEIFNIDVQTNSRYDLNYVQADKAAADALSYVDGANYLLETFGSTVDGGSILAACTEELHVLADRSVAAGGNGDDGALDRTAIESAQHKLYSAILNYCRRNNIMREHVNRGSLPSAIYTQLQSANETYIPAATPAATPDDGETGGINETEGID